MLTRALATATAVVALAVAPAAAQAPNLTGEWELDVAASSFGPRSKPQRQTLRVQHAEPALRTVTTTATDRGESTITNSYSTDGQPSRNGAEGAESLSSARWEGRTLAIVTQANLQGGHVDMQERWTLSDGGRTLTVVRLAATPVGRIDMTLVYRRKSG